MKKTFRRYNLIIAAMLLPIVLSLLITSTMIEPLNGNMTRIGGYLESDYAGTAQVRLENRSSERHGNYDRYSDVVVLGDSFRRIPNGVGQIIC